MLRLVRSDLGKELYEAENERYRNAARGLSAARDAEVRLQTLRDLRERYPREFPPRGANRLEQALAAERDALIAGARAGAAGRLRVVANQIDEGRDVIAEWPLHSDRWRLVGPGLTRSYERGRKLYEVAMRDPGVENVHEWRKRVKDLRYQVRVISVAWEPVLGALAAEARALGEALGEHHDLADLIEETTRREDLISKPMIARLEALAERRQAELFADAAELGERIYAESPKAFERRMRSYWKAWRAEAPGL